MWPFFNICLLSIQNEIRNLLKMCKYYKYFDELGKDNQDDLLNMSIKRIYKYITRTQLHKGTLIYLRSYNEDKNRSITKEGYYLFEVIG